jgi:hypothetical protein
MKLPLFILIFSLLFFPFSGRPRHTALHFNRSFIAPDTVCRGYEVVVTNTGHQP